MSSEDFVLVLRRRQLGPPVFQSGSSCCSEELSIYSICLPFSSSYFIRSALYSFAHCGFFPLCIVCLDGLHFNLQLPKVSYSSCCCSVRQLILHAKYSQQTLSWTCGEALLKSVPDVQKTKVRVLFCFTIPLHQTFSYHNSGFSNSNLLFAGCEVSWVKPHSFANVLG